MKIVKAKKADGDQIWSIFKEVIEGGDTYVNDEKTTKKQALEKWLGRGVHCFVMKEGKEIFGAYILKENQVGRGSHVANGSYIVSSKARGKGVGKALALHSIEKAKKLKFHAIQFNFVVSTNKAAVALWQSVGFEILATLPKAFKHKVLGYVDAFVMFRKL